MDQKHRQIVSLFSVDHDDTKKFCIKYHEEKLSFSGNGESQKMHPKIPKYSTKEMTTCHNLSDLLLKNTLCYHN